MVAIIQETGFFLKKIFYLFIFRERGRDGEREGEKHRYVVASCMSPTGDLACNPGTCPDWESNWRPFGLQASTQSMEPPQAGLLREFLRGLKKGSPTTLLSK